MSAMRQAILLLVALLSGLIATVPAVAADGIQRAPAAAGHTGLLVLGADGRTFLRHDRYLPAGGFPAAQAHASKPTPAVRFAQARAAATHPPTVTGALSQLKAHGTITSTSYSQYRSAFLASQHTLKKLSGQRHTELAAVLANIQAIASSGGFIPTRLPALFLTLERNRQWWSTGPLLSYGQRVSFPGSRIVWEYYPGQGVEIQWLGTFGEANGYFLAGNQNTALKDLLGEVIGLASSRAGGIAWEYMFQFDGGLPPWTSGLSQGTALQVLTRAWSRFGEQSYLTAAQQALGIFKTAPPSGVRVATAAGAEYAEYTYAPSDRILNGFIQSLVGLYDYTELTKDPLGEQLFQAGDAEARAEVPHYDTGGWSKYDQHSESDLNYHELLAEFLLHLCQRTKKGPPLPVLTPTPTPTPAPTPPAPVSPSGGSPPAGTSNPPAQAASSHHPTPIPGDEIYCTTAENFQEDLHTPPVIALLTQKLRTGSHAGVQFSLSKVSSVKLVVSRNGRAVWSNSATVEGGKPRLLWITPAKGGEYSVSLHAVDLAGNSATVEGKITLAH